jgi:hypothetical protein
MRTLHSQALPNNDGQKESDAHHVHQTLPSVPLFCLAPVPFWLLAAALDIESLAHLAAGLGLALGLGWIRALLRNPTLMLGFLKLGGVMLLIIMSLGWLMALFFNLSSLGQNLSTALVVDIGTTLPAYASAVAYALVFAAVLGALGGLAHIRALEASAVRRFFAARGIRPRKLLILIGVICLLEIWLIFSGVISYRTFAIAGFDEGSIAWHLPMLQIMFAAQAGLNAIAISQIVENTAKRNKLAIALVFTSFLLILFITFTQGRSGFVFCALLHFYWATFFIGKMPNFRAMIPILAITLPLLYTGSLLSNFMRSDAVQGADLKIDGFGTFLGNAIDTWQSDQTLQAAEKARSAANLASRPLVANPLAKSMALPDEQKTFLLGENLFNSAIWSIPNFFISSKRAYPVQEELLYQNFPIGINDTADSIYLYAYADFAYMGLLVYPTLIAGIWVFVLLLMRLPHISSLGVVVFSCMWISMFTLSMGESSTITWFVLLRNGIIALPFIAIAAKLFSFPRYADGKQTK